MEGLGFRSLWLNDKPQAVYSWRAPGRATLSEKGLREQDLGVQVFESRIWDFAVWDLDFGCGCWSQAILHLKPEALSL